MNRPERRPSRSLGPIVSERETATDSHASRPPLGPTRQCECSPCGRRFGGVTGFDAHRRHGICTDPAALGYTLDARGFWTLPMTPEARERLYGGTP